MKSHFIFGRAYVYFLLRSSCLDYSHFLFLCVCVLSHSPCSTDSLPSATCGSPAGEKTEKTFHPYPKGPSDILTSDKLLPFAIWYSTLSLFPRSHHELCQEYIPQCFMSPCRGQKIMTRHHKLPLRAFSHKRQRMKYKGREGTRYNDRERERKLRVTYILF